MKNFIETAYAKLESIKTVRDEIAHNGIHSRLQMPEWHKTRDELNELKNSVKNDDEKQMLKILLKSFNLK